LWHVIEGKTSKKSGAAKGKVLSSGTSSSHMMTSRHKATADERWAARDLIFGGFVRAAGIREAVSVAAR
jgi:hypothetical protein